MVEKIKSFGPELKVHTLGQVKLAPQRKIDLVKRKTAEGVTSQAPLLAGGRRTERAFTPRTSAINGIVQAFTSRRSGIVQIDRYAGCDIHTPLHRPS